MRINVYAEELTDVVEIIEKKPDNRDVTFYGVRMYLESSDKLHHSPGDDDRSAITMWVPWTKAGGHDFQRVIKLLDMMAGTLERVWAAQSDKPINLVPIQGQLPVEEHADPLAELESNAFHG